MRAKYPTHLILLDLIILTIFGWIIQTEVHHYAAFFTIRLPPFIQTKILHVTYIAP
jgi:hypothetical protein